VTDRKGDIIAYPKVILSSPFAENIDTHGRGAEHRKLMDVAICSQSHILSLWLGRAAADDVAYYYKPSATCNATFRACSDVMDTEIVVLSLEEVCYQTRRACLSWTTWSLF
jgi:hypothetical protein